MIGFQEWNGLERKNSTNHAGGVIPTAGVYGTGPPPFRGTGSPSACVREYLWLSAECGRRSETPGNAPGNGLFLYRRAQRGGFGDPEYLCGTRTRGTEGIWQFRRVDAYKAREPGTGDRGMRLYGAGSAGKRTDTPLLRACQSGIRAARPMALPGTALADV